MKLLATSVHTMAFPEIALMNWLFSRVETGHEELLWLLMCHTIKMPGGRRLLIKKLNKCKGLMKGEDFT
jgi:hypothetical protein